MAFDRTYMEKREALLVTRYRVSHYYTFYNFNILHIATDYPYLTFCYDFALQSIDVLSNIITTVEPTIVDILYPSRIFQSHLLS